MAAETILIIEDDPAMLRGLTDNFQFEGYNVKTASDGETGLAMATDDRPDLVLLDIMLPKINGYEICRLIRAAGLDMPVIMLTAKGQESEIVLGLNLGADDYVTKPFSVRELIARVAAFLRRARRAEEIVFTFGDCELNIASRRLTRGGADVELTPKEFDLLAMLARGSGRAFGRDQILSRVWGAGVFVTTRSVDRCVTTLRGKIEPEPHRPVYIRTIREVGYRFDADALASE